MSGEPIRTCISCSCKRNKSELNRHVWSGSSPLSDPRQVKAGRGAYHCDNDECRERFYANSKRLKRAFRLN